jgi:membrane dipeptidase
VCRNFFELNKAVKEGKIAAILTIEGGAAINGDLSRIQYLRTCGVRMITLGWNGENELGSGNVTQNGLTRFGKKAVKELERCDIIIDVSHLNDRGFWDLCEIASKPLSQAIRIQVGTDNKRN